MRKLFVYMGVVLFLAITPMHLKAENKLDSVSTAKKETAEVKALIDRINEIKAMDRSTMSAKERKEIRKELRAIKKEMKMYHRNGHGGGAIYISGGLLVFILILIIIF